MSKKSKIEWTDSTWNPITGCTKISEGCKNCYAERIAKRFWNRPFSEIICHEDRLDIPAHWRKPRSIFVCSMSDLFHKDVPDEFILRIFQTISVNRRHRYMILTKRPERMKKWFDENAQYIWNYHGPNEPQRPYCMAPWPDPCIWLGVTAETQQHADERIPILLQIPAAVHFVSIEPMLEQIDLKDFQPFLYKSSRGKLRGLFGIDSGWINWVIAGCESGPAARSFNWLWALSLKNQCANASVPFYYKQGRYLDNELIKTPVLDGKQWMEYPETKA